MVFLFGRKIRLFGQSKKQKAIISIDTAIVCDFHNNHTVYAIQID